MEQDKKQPSSFVISTKSHPLFCLFNKVEVTGFQHCENTDEAMQIIVPGEIFDVRQTSVVYLNGEAENFLAYRRKE